MVTIPEKNTNRIAGAVILYNPQSECIKNIFSYLNQVDLFIIVDNSDSPSKIKLEELVSLPKVTYVSNAKNLGIAYALNQAVNIAKKENYDFLLTMDQDSLADNDLIKNYNSFLTSSHQKQIGILAPTVYYLQEESVGKIIEDREIKTAISSGSLLNINAYEKAGSFKEKLFIDYVDFEYCLRLSKVGLKIIQVANAKIYHQLGKLEEKKFIFKKIYITNHSPLRYYYRTRNRLYVIRKYFVFCPIFAIKDILIYLNELIKIISFEHSKFLKLKMIFWGWVDFFADKYGKFENNR